MCMRLSLCLNKLQRSNLATAIAVRGTLDGCIMHSVPVGNKLKPAQPRKRSNSESKSSNDCRWLKKDSFCHCPGSADALPSCPQ